MSDLSFETIARNRGANVIAGVDEAGRGPWAGPVVAAAVVLDMGRLTPSIVSKLDDSKKLTRSRRLELFDPLYNCSEICIGIAEVFEIDTLNILSASMLAMRRAVEGLQPPADMALVDGPTPPPLSCEVCCIVKGDAQSVSISAASVVAKVTRDQMMADLASKYPGYGWERNSGYGTVEHREALRRFGTTPHHRLSFAPIAKLLNV